MASRSGLPSARLRNASGPRPRSGLWGAPWRRRENMAGLPEPGLHPHRSTARATIGCVARRSKPPHRARVTSNSRIGGVCLVGAALTFWLAWFLMPMPGTTDVAFILEQVAATPERVWLWVGVQILSAALFIPGLLALARVSGIGDSSLG